MPDSLSRGRVRGSHVAVCSVAACGGQVLLVMRSDRELGFATAPGRPLAVSGLEVEPMGCIRFGERFEPSRVEIRSVRPVGLSAKAHDDEDRDPVLNRRLEREILRAASRAAAEQPCAFAGAYLEVADDLALERMLSISTWRAKLSDHPDAPYSDRRIWENLAEEAERNLAGLDTQLRDHGAWFEARAGYVVLCDGRPMMNPPSWDRRGAKGWITRFVFDTHAAADRAVKDIGRSEAEIVRIRIARGEVWEVVADGLVRPTWSFEQGVLTDAFAC